MGREIRMVPPNWKHPLKYGYTDRLQPMCDETWDHAVAEWKREYAEWEAGTHPHYRAGSEFWVAWSPPPEDPVCYRPWRDEEATWFQCWETISDGTPVSPPFATLAELAAHLAEHGDDWDRERGRGGWGSEAAQAFVRSGHSPSMMISGGEVIESKDIPLRLEKEAASPQAD